MAKKLDHTTPQSIAKKVREAGNRSEALRNVIRNTNGMAMPDAEVAEALTGMKGALNKARNMGRPVPFKEEGLIEVRHLAGFILDFADQADLMARGRSATLELKISDELRRMAERGVEGDKGRLT